MGYGHGAGFRHGRRDGRRVLAGMGMLVVLMLGPLLLLVLLLQLLQLLLVLQRP